MRRSLARFLVCLLWLSSLAYLAPPARMMDCCAPGACCCEQHPPAPQLCTCNSHADLALPLKTAALPLPDVELFAASIADRPQQATSTFPRGALPLPRGPDEQALLLAQLDLPPPQ